MTRCLLALGTAVLIGCADHRFDNPVDSGAGGRGLEVVAVYRIAVEDPRDLAWDGLNLLVADAASRRVLLLDPLTGAQRSSFPVPGSGVAGVASDQVNRYLADPVVQRIDRTS